MTDKIDLNDTALDSNLITNKCFFSRFFLRLSGPQTKSTAVQRTGHEFLVERTGGEGRVFVGAEIVGGEDVFTGVGEQQLVIVDGDLNILLAKFSELGCIQF